MASGRVLFIAAAQVDPNVPVGVDGLDRQAGCAEEVRELVGMEMGFLVSVMLRTSSILRPGGMVTPTASGATGDCEQGARIAQGVIPGPG